MSGSITRGAQIEHDLRLDVDAVVVGTGAGDWWRSESSRARD